MSTLRRPGCLLAFVLLVTGPALGYNLYFGDLHTHTSYSDGQRFPRDAYRYARDTARIDVLAVTDHDFQLDWNEWVASGQQADSATEPGRFVALRGFEWSGSSDGHVNVFETDTFVSRVNVPGMTEFYPWLYTQPRAVGQFNHIGSGDFDNYHYVERADSAMALCEMKTMPQSRRYIALLDSGWVVGAAAGSDTHLADWGMAQNQVGIWADSLTRGSILAAIRAMRTYATLNRNTRLEFACNGAWMGSRIGNGSLHFSIRVSDPDPQDTIRRVELVTNSGVVAQSITVGNSGSVDWSPSLATASGERRWFLARVVWGDSVWTTSSPIWTSGPAAVEEMPATVTPRAPGLELSPNPARAGGAVRLVVHGVGDGPAELVVCDALGRTVGRSAVDARQSSFDVPALNAGIYLVRLRSAGRVTAAKLVVR